MNIISNLEWPEAMPLPYIDYTGSYQGPSITSEQGEIFISRRRRFYTTYPRLNVRWVLTALEFDRMENFYKIDLYNGVRAFSLELIYPKNSALTNWLVKFDGPWTATYHSGGVVEVQALILLFQSIEIDEDLGPVDEDPIGDDGEDPILDEGGEGTTVSCPGGSKSWISSDYFWFLGPFGDPHGIDPELVNVYKALYTNERNIALAALVSAGNTISGMGTWYWGFVSSPGTFKSALQKTQYPSTDPTSTDGDWWVTTEVGGWVLITEVCVVPPP